HREAGCDECRDSRGADPGNCRRRVARAPPYLACGPIPGGPRSAAGCTGCRGSGRWGEADSVTSRLIAPGATLGILGGGQLGRMTGYAALEMGYEVAVLDPDATAPARAVARKAFIARFDDRDAAVALAR